MHTLDYYYFESCPFCRMVQTVIRQHKIKVNYKDISKDSSALEKLVADTGRRTVPCLYIDNNPMHESSDIIEWLEANANKLEKE